MVTEATDTGHWERPLQIQTKLSTDTQDHSHRCQKARDNSRAVKPHAQVLFHKHHKSLLSVHLGGTALIDETDVGQRQLLRGLYACSSPRDTVPHLRSLRLAI